MKARFLKVAKWTFIVLLSAMLALTVFVFFYMRQDKFGNAPEGERLSTLEASKHFIGGTFQNNIITPDLTEGHTILEVTYDQFFNPAKRRNPTDKIPSVKTDLLNLPRDQDILVWFGHSSYFIQIDGKRILLDPVFSGNASPVPGTVKAFYGTDIYTVDDLPEIDYLFISHDHYDHVDYETLIKLQPKTKKVICGLGVGSHFELWGYDKGVIIEQDWNQSATLDSGFIAHTTPARHFSGRSFSRNNTLWASYILQTPTMKLYFGGDSGYGPHFAEIGNTFGPIDLAILDNGQYSEKWRYVHTLPDEVLKAAMDLKAKRLFPVHSSKFVLANHSWDEPLIRITELNKSVNIPLVTPMIGEQVNLKDEQQQFSQWWVGVE